MRTEPFAGLRTGRRVRYPGLSHSHLLASILNLFRCPPDHHRRPEALRRAVHEPDTAIREVPYILAGDASGYLRTGQFVDVKITNTKLLDTIGSAVGCTDGQGGPLDDFGDPSLQGGLVAPIIA